MTFPSVPEHPSDQGPDGDSGAGGSEAGGGGGRYRSAELAGSAGSAELAGSAEFTWSAGAAGAYAADGASGAAPGPASSAPLSGYPGGMPSGPYGASYPAGPQAGPQVPGSAPIAYGNAYGAQRGNTPDRGRRAIPDKNSGVGLFALLIALLACNLMLFIFGYMGRADRFSPVDAAIGFMRDWTTWIVVLGIVQTVMRRPILSFIPAAAMLVVSLVLRSALLINYMQGLLNEIVGLILLLAEVVMLVGAGWMSWAGRRGQLGSIPISVSLPFGVAQLMLILAMVRLVDAPFILLLSGVSESFEQYGLDMKLGYFLSWNAAPQYMSSQYMKDAAPFGVGIVILIVVGLASAGAVVMCRPGGSRAALMVGSAAASGILLLQTLYTAARSNSNWVVILGYAVPLVIAAAALVGMSLAALTPSARAWFAGQWPPSQAVHRPPYPGRPPAVQAYRVQGPWSS